MSADSTYPEAFFSLGKDTHHLESEAELQLSSKPEDGILVSENNGVIITVR